MRIAIAGAGNVGTKLGMLARQAGHDVIYGVRTAKGPEEFPAAELSAAIADADLVVLAVPFTACAEMLPPVATGLAGKIVVDATNPLQADWSPLALGEGNSGAQTIAALLPRARVVKAFNTVFADIMTREGLDRAGRRVTAFVAGDDETACATVAAFAASLGLAPAIVGPLPLARYLEGIAHLNIAIAIGRSGGTNAAFIFDQRKS
ncbi:MAG: NAD(P)-binding domain-containing protein [Tagaea sp.]|nr:NAD(P)-binding domain-containing protein [Tagaea sp.]